MDQPYTSIAAEETVALLEKAEEVAHVGCWVVDLRTPTRVIWSAETYRIYGVCSDYQPHAEALQTFVHPDDSEAARGAANAAIENGAGYDTEHRIVRGDGSIRWVHQRADVVRDADGTPVRLIGTVQDVTEKRQLEEQLYNAQRLEAVGRLAGGIAHDLNNALTAIIGYSELAFGALEDDHPARPDVQEIRRAAARAESVTRQLLAFSRKQVLEPRVFPLAESIDGLSRVIQSTVGPGIGLIVDKCAAGHICGDPGQIEQVILNIVVNARDAMPNGGTLTMSVRESDVDAALAAKQKPMAPGRYVELRIADTGNGMDAATKARIFEPFFTTKEVGKGTGLGLAMVYGTIKQSGGFIYVDSEPGRGTAFSIYFPPADAGLARAAAPAGSSPAGATILVVEDEAPVRAIITTTLRRKGHHVLHAASAAEALDICAREMRPIDLLLTDAVMPGMSGIELGRTLGPMRPTMRIVIMSGFSEEALHLSDGHGAAVLLQKPFTPSELQRVIGEVLAARPS